jgi:hypothetical protein
LLVCFFFFLPSDKDGDSAMDCDMEGGTAAAGGFEEMVRV